MLRNIKKRMSRGSSFSSQESADFATPRQQQQQQQQQDGASAAPSTPPAASSSSAPTNTNASNNNAPANNNNTITKQPRAAKFKNAGKALGNNIKASLKKQHGQSLQQERTTLPDQLASFDSCVDAADALAASAAASSSMDREHHRSNSSGGDNTILPPRKDDGGSGLPDCSVLVSPDGDLLLVPRDDALFQELMTNGKDDYESAVFLGSDLRGDAALNGFGAVGWSIPAATAALQQTHLSLKDCLQFTEDLVLSKKEHAARTAAACNDLRNNQPPMGGVAPDWELLDYHHVMEGPGGGAGASNPSAAQMLPSSPRRVGPLCSGSSTLNATLCELERYHSACAEHESGRWWKESRQRTGCLVALRSAEATFAERCRRRQDAIQHTSSRARRQEEELNTLKQRAEDAWNAVYQAEDLVTQRVEVIMQGRSREREKQRLEQIRQQHDEAYAAAMMTTSASVDSGDDGSTPSSPAGNNAAPTPTLGATNEEIWNLVSAVAESMEGGSFEPMADLPSVPLSIPRDRSADEQDSPSVTGTRTADADGGASTASTTDTVSLPPLPPIPVASREQIELDVGLPQLRQAAMAADELVADSADALMNMLVSMDTTRRSARVAAETSLLSACNAQAACIKSLVKLERESLEERLKELESLEAVLDSVDVRADLNAYITADKKERGGLSALGDDDDGGIASALAILSRHVDGSLGYVPTPRLSMDTQQPHAGGEHDEGKVAAGMLENILETIFSQTPPPNGVDDIADRVDLLCNAVSGTGSAARTQRSTICYALNSKRSARAEIARQGQFDALCKLFSAILTGCNAEDGGVSYAKMCIMLAQTFYMVRKKDAAVDADQPQGRSPPRNHRIYVKCFLKDHPLWEKDDFWDHALSQQISESLTHSGVMQNFEKSWVNAGLDRKKSEWTEMRKTKWYDLTYKERIQAASQVQAVVFAQLGALAHSMMELGCGLQRSCAFVRRMAIRHQLPSSQRTMLLQHLVGRDDLEKGGEEVPVGEVTKGNESQDDNTHVTEQITKDDGEDLEEQAEGGSERAASIKDAEELE